MLRYLVLFLLLFSGWEARSAAELWSLRPVGDPQTPATADHPVDAFLSGTVAFSAPADRRTLARRLSYSLTGLPPDPKRVEAFAQDKRPDAQACKALVDEWLASPHYGEHWGRRWLDVVRYADTAGENSDHPLPHAWRYRNWVIDAFNRDQPYDDFVRLQVAGDLLTRDQSPERKREGIIATGYLAISRRFGHDIDKENHLMFEDTIDNLGKAFLGLSIACARCHDHKHDPISTKDYYALYSVFDSTTFSFPGCEPKQQPRDLVLLEDQTFLARRVAWEKQRAALTLNLAEQENRLKEQVAACAKVVSKGDVPDGGSVHATPEPLSFEVKKGEVINLSILPQGNYGADTTILDYTISSSSGDETIRWSPKDHLDDLLTSNPLPSHDGATWCFLDTTDARPHFLAGPKDGVDGQASLQAWENGMPPSVLVNRSPDPVKVWTTLPGRTFYCHPGPKGPVSIAWLSPIDGEVQIELTVSDGHPAGDGVAWLLEHFPDPKLASAYLDLGKASVKNDEREAALAAHMRQEPKAEAAYAVREGKPVSARIQNRGEPEDLGEEIPRSFIAALGGKPLGDEATSGRLELAQQIASSENPLFARVMVNRIWAGHFGQGLVPTPNDFGHHGAPLEYPELLDYLARRFVESGWSVKAMHRLILSSETYRQAAGESLVPRRRITVEELRDTLLVAAGRLDRTPGEAHPFPPEQGWNFTQHNPFSAEYATDKRSVYVMRKRNRSIRFFALFNGADPNASTAVRDVTTAPTQALFFMNDPFFHDCAEAFAGRIREAGERPRERLDFACRELFGRPVRNEEVAVFVDFAEALKPTLSGAEQETEIWKAYARVLLGSNELLHID